MGTNLSQVFILNNGNLEAPGGDGADSPLDLGKSEVGIWNLTQYGANSDNWINSALYAKKVDTDTSNADDTTVEALTVANPLWLFNRIQFGQGTGSGNPIMSPIINTRDIRRIIFEPQTDFVGTKATITNTKLGAVASGAFQGNLKFVIKSTPTDQLSFYDQAGLNIFGDFPLGAFNTTNHKAINVTVNFDGVDAVDTTIQSDIADRMAEHPILSKLFKAPAISTDDVVIEAIHPGVVFDVILTNVDDDASTDLDITGQVLGVGNDWQVIGEEVRCRSRYGNFNRMYLPQNVPTFGTVGNKYHKVVVEYEHNWPSSTGIAPAGELNQIVIYASDSSTAMAAADTTIDAAFALANVTAAQEFIW